MLKKIYLLFFCLLAASCTLFGSNQSSPKDCPNVIINRSDAYLTQNVGYKNQLKIELYGYEGYCYFDYKTNRAKAALTPLFKVTRLDGTSNEGYVSFDFYYRTSKGPTEYLGSKMFYEKIALPAKTKVFKFKGKTFELKVPSVEDGSFEIYLGLKLTKSDRTYNDMTYDLN